MIARTAQRQASKSKEQIVDSAIRLISKYGFEQLTLDQVGVAANAKRYAIVAKYGNLGNLMQVCLQSSLDSLALFLSLRSYRNDYREHKTEDFWALLVAFNTHNAEKASVICRYLRSPSIFQAQEFRVELIKLLNPIYDHFEQGSLQNSNVHIRFISFKYLYQSACTYAENKAASQLSHTASAGIYYNNKVAPELERILRLPIN